MKTYRFLSTVLTLVLLLTTPGGWPAPSVAGAEDTGGAVAVAQEHAVVRTSASVVQAASCSHADVQAALDAASDGDTLVIPPGYCTWNDTLYITKGITLQGSGQDATVLSASSSTLMRVNMAGGSFRMTGIGFTAVPGYSSWLIMLDGVFASLRVDHCKFTNIHDRPFVIGYYSDYDGHPAIKGVFDHITHYSDVQKTFMIVYGRNDSWLAPDDLGGENAIYVEDSDFTWQVPGVNSGIFDGESGARFVIRTTTITNGHISWHDTGSTPQARSTRAFEVYNNKLICTETDCGWSAIHLRGGTGVIYSNTIPIYPNGYLYPSSTQIYRVTHDGGRPWTPRCDSVTDRICSDFMSHCNGGDYRACYGDFDCVGVGDGTCSIDACTLDSQCGSGNTCLAKLDGHLDSFGWPCRDQTGRGQDDPVTHVQASAPVYWWDNRDTADNQLSVYVAPANTDYIKPNRDYYDYSASFDGTSNMGTGLKSTRPATCTPGVAYWATDENRLYKCTATDTWSLHYAPYTYPHPLTQELDLHGAPASTAIHLDWTVHAYLPPTATWQIDYYSATLPSLVLTVTNLVSSTRAYTLTGLTNYELYTVTLHAMVDNTPFLSDTVAVMPTDVFVYLPLVSRED